jgi:hypothetical protein
VLRPRSLSRALALALAVAGLAATSAGAEHLRLVVIVNKARPENDLKSKALEKILLGELKFWENGDRIRLLMPPASTSEPARQKLFAAFLKIDPRDFSQQWRAMVFRGEQSQAPFVLDDERAVVQAVFGSPKTLAIVEADKVSKLAEVARVLTLDGKALDDPGYPLKW